MYGEGFVRLGNPLPLTGSLLLAYRDLDQAVNAIDWLAKTKDFKQQALQKLATISLSENKT